MQEEVLKLVLLALSEGALISRKVLVMYIVQTLEKEYPQASKTSVGHVVQLLYRASCFNVIKRDAESSLMQLKEEFRSYDALRREHDAQIVQIAMEAGLRISPDQWSALLYGDQAHKSHMQSIIDRLQSPQSFCQCIQELLISLQRTGDPGHLSDLRTDFDNLADIDLAQGDNTIATWCNVLRVLHSVKTVIDGQVNFSENYGGNRNQRDVPDRNVVAYKFKTSMCRDIGDGKTCQRGDACTFAHSLSEMERFRTRSRLIGYRSSSSSTTHIVSAGPGPPATAEVSVPPPRALLPRLLMPSAAGPPLGGNPCSAGPGPGGTRPRMPMDFWDGRLQPFDMQRAKAFIVQQPAGLLNGYSQIQVASQQSIKMVPVPVPGGNNDHVLPATPPIQSIPTVLTGPAGPGVLLPPFPLSPGAAAFTPALLGPARRAGAPPSPPVVNGGAGGRPCLQMPLTINAPTSPPAEFGLYLYSHHPLASPYRSAAAAASDVVHWGVPMARVVPCNGQQSTDFNSYHFSGVVPPPQLTPIIETYYTFASPAGVSSTCYESESQQNNDSSTTNDPKATRSHTSSALEEQRFCETPRNSVEGTTPVTNLSTETLQKNRAPYSNVFCLDRSVEGRNLDTNSEDGNFVSKLNDQDGNLPFKVTSSKRHRSSSLTDDWAPTLEEYAGEDDEQKTYDFVHRIASSIFDDGVFNDHTRLKMSTSCGPRLLKNHDSKSHKVPSHSPTASCALEALNNKEPLAAAMSVPCAIKSTLRRSSSLRRSLSSDEEEKRRLALSLITLDANQLIQGGNNSWFAKTTPSGDALSSPSMGAPFWRHHSDADFLSGSGMVVAAVEARKTCKQTSSLSENARRQALVDLMSRNHYAKRDFDAEVWRSDEDQFVPFSGGMQVSRYGPISRARPPITVDASMWASRNLTSLSNCNDVLQVKGAYARPLSTAVVQPLATGHHDAIMENDSLLMPKNAEKIYDRAGLRQSLSLDGSNFATKSAENDNSRDLLPSEFQRISLGIDEKIPQP